MNAHDIQEWIDHLNDEATESYINTVVLTKNDGSGNRRDNLKVTFDTKKANKIFTNHITPIRKKVHPRNITGHTTRTNTHPHISNKTLTTTKKTHH